MSKPFIFFYALLILVSCNKETSKESSNSDENTAKIGETLKELELKLEQEQLKSDSLKGVVIKKGYEIDSLKQTNNEQAITLANNSFDFLTNKPNMVSFAIKHLHLKSENVLSSVWNYGLIYTYKFHKDYRASITGENDLLNTFWNKISRDSENIESFLSYEDKQKIYTLFKYNTIYEDSGIAAFAKALIASYDEIEIDEEAKLILLNLQTNLYKIDTDDYWESYEESFRIIKEELLSENVSDILSDSNYSSYDDGSDFDNRIFFTYSFWARRQKEGNKEVVYRLINEFHNNISKEKKEEVNEN